MRRPMVNVFLLLCIASQSLAAPLHLMGPADLTNSQAIEAECPAHSDTAAEAGNPESCECSGGACCKGRIDRPSAHAVTNTESQPVEYRPVLLAESAVACKSIQLISGAQSRAPPVTSPI
jgi:hypothetical protein